MDDVEGRFAALTMRSLLRDLVDVSAHSTTLDGGEERPVRMVSHHRGFSCL